MCLFLSFSVRVYLAFSRDESIWQVRALSGKLPGSGGKGLVDSLIYKRKLRDHLLKDVMPTYKWDPAITAAIRSAALDPITFGKKTTAEDLTWRAGWPTSAELFFEFIEQSVFSFDFDLGDFVKKNKSVSDMMDSPEARAFVDEVDTAWEAERPKPVESKKSNAKEPAVTVPEAPDQADPHLGAQLGKSADEADLQKLRRFKSHCKKMVAAHVCLVVEPASEQGIAKAINDTKAGQVRGGTATDEETGDTESKSYVHITYDPKVGGEASSFPHLRVPPLRGSGSHLGRMVKGVQAARGKPSEIHPGDLFVIFDGMKDGNTQVLTSNPFRTADGQGAMKKASRKIMLLYNEKSLQKRLGKKKTKKVVKQMEQLHLITAAPMNVPYIEHKRFDGSNRGETLGFINACQWTKDPSVWRLPIDEKKVVITIIIITPTRIII